MTNVSTTRSNKGAHKGAGSDSGLSVFFFESLRSLSVTASIFPSSRSLASALLRPVDFASATVLLELGVGTGAITAEILRRMEPHARLYAIDINPVFVSHVSDRIRDSRLTPILGDAKNLAVILQEIGVQSADAVVSSLGLTSMKKGDRSAIMTQAAAYLSDTGVLTQYQYLHARASRWISLLGAPNFSEEDFLRGHFRHVRSEKVLWNLPPAAVYTCKF
jgi:phospholipid N-methyltransferase